MDRKISQQKALCRRACSRPFIRLCLPCVALLLAGMALPVEAAAEGLYGPHGVTPQAVQQGKLGSCYFHAVIAALAQAEPQKLQGMIQSGSEGTYSVTFADGTKETAYPEDLQYTQQSGYDRSEGLWVAVLFRAYAQRVLRQSLAAAIDKSDLFTFVKSYAQDLITSNDLVLLAYDRAIRSQVDQKGNIDRTKLEAQLLKELGPISVPNEAKNSFIKLLDSGGFFDSMVEAIKQNGEIFGAYRAVGQGGIAERVMQTLTGTLQVVLNDSETQAGPALEQVFKEGRPVVACSGGSVFYEQVAAGKPLPDETKTWYVNAHCYTALAYNPNSRMVTLRNPWGHFPNEDGVFDLPVRTFVPAFRGIITTE